MALVSWVELGATGPLPAQRAAQFSSFSGPGGGGEDSLEAARGPDTGWAPRGLTWLSSEHDAEDCYVERHGLEGGTLGTVRRRLLCRQVSEGPGAAGRAWEDRG